MVSDQRDEKMLPSKYLPLVGDQTVAISLVASGTPMIAKLAKKLLFKAK